MRTHAQKPTPIARLLALALTALIPGATARADELVMPYSCQMVGGRPLLIGASPQTFRITGQHDQRKITICSPADPNRCRAWNVHSFNVNCGGTEVSWPTLIAGSPPARDGRARLENGRFQLSMPPAWNLPASDPCARQMDAPSQHSDPQLERYCANRPDLTQPSSVEMPAGFAPTLGLDIKINTGNSPVAAAPLAPNSARPDSSLTAQTPNGGLKWKASPVAPPQPGTAQAGVPFDPSSPPQAPAKKQPSEPKTAARGEPTIKPTPPPLEPSASVRPAPVTAARPEPIVPRPSTIERPAEERRVERPAAEPTAPPVAVAPPVPVPAAKPVDPPTKVAALPLPESKPVPELKPLPTPIAAPPQASAPPVLPPQTATSESTKSTQVAESSTKQEPYSSRPQKLSQPNSSYSITSILIAATLALTAFGAFLWRRRERDSGDAPAGPLIQSSPVFDNAFDAHHTRTIPSLSGPMSPDGLHRSHETRSADPAFGPYGKYAVEPGFDDPLGPILSDRPGTAETNASDQHHLEPAISEPGLTQDWSNPGHTLSIPAHDEAAHPSATGSTQLIAKPAPPAAPSNRAGAAEWSTEMPQTQDDALHILGMGVTSKASLTAMKKIVDGLRLSWHPDHASDDADHAIRELRIRQINAAWDILTTGYNGDPVI